MKNSKGKEHFVIGDKDIVTVTKMNHITEIQYMQRRNTRQSIQKLSSEEYVVLDTGEVKLFEKAENRSEGKISLYKTFKKLRYLINNNFTGSKNELFVTLTFAPNDLGWRPTVGDTDYLAKAFKVYLQRLKRCYGSVDFIRVLEPHEDGHAHYHVLLKFIDKDSVFIKNSDMAKLWSKGFVKIHSLKDVDNIGAYVSAYLTDVEFNEQAVLKSMLAGENVEVIEKDGKKYIKGGRVKYYPTGKQIYNKSKGILEPERTTMYYSKAKKIVGSAKPTFEKNIVIETNDFSNVLRFESYNSKRV